MNRKFTPLQHSVSPSGSPRPLSPLDYSSQFNSQMVASSTGANASSPSRKRGGSFQPKLITGDEKYRKKAAHLYHLYKKACLLEQSQQSQTQIYAAGQIYVPPPATSRSAPSRPSKHYSASVSASIFGGSVFGGTDPSSVIDFTGDGSPDSAIGKEGKSVYDGKLVKERRRRNLTPKEKAKAALIRHLKACKSCKERSVGVSQLSIPSMTHPDYV
ncbi:hypothetical protein B0O99DRAFT_189002 [Bisporella sp. PMI_857]|nr:hypothetical protein B0O99DRAFT_189002 [Bisporella sp. PMI_857]